MKKIGNAEIIKRSQLLYLCRINGIKTDFVNYQHPWLDKPVLMQGIRMASLKDIAAMKLNAIAGRGSRKDFVDLFFLLKKFDLNEMMNFFIEKYSSTSPFLVMKSLTWFEDAEKSDMPVMIKKADWELIKKTIIKKTNSVI